MANEKTSVTPADIAMPIVGGIASAVYNEYSQRQAEKRSVRYSKELADYNYNLQRRAERDAPMNQKIGLERAGLSTALATEGKFSAPVGNSATPPSTQGQRIDPMYAADLLSKQLQNKLLAEEVRSKDIDNTHKEDEDATIDMNLRRILDQILQNPNLSEDDRRWFNAMRENSHPYSLGSRNGLDKFLDLDVKVQTSKLAKNEARFKNELINFKRENGSIEAIQKMDIAQLNSLVMHTALAKMQLMSVAAGIPKTEQEIRTLESQAMKNIAEANSIYHGDIAELWKQKDFGALIAHYVDVGISEGVGLVGLGYKAKVAEKAIAKTSELKQNLARADAKYKHQSRMAQIKYKAELDDWHDARRASRNSKFPHRSRK